ncbi:unnamed protein product [Ranitomeya imitator]|uniref:Protein S-acyltransferase n=1 Tax=Ranitomeya imitator TaxID=111125 RepID=A0ABN9L5D8_9NEOB|nr:unnamed protein product [Ranitomeya imitator]
MQSGCRMALSRGLRCCQRVLSWVPVVIISSVVLWSYYAYVWELCIVTVEHGLEKAVYLFIFHTVFLLFVWTYWKAIFTLPKQPTKKFLLPYVEKERYDIEERPEVQRQILSEFAKKLPVYTRTGSGGQYKAFPARLKPGVCVIGSSLLFVLFLQIEGPFFKNTPVYDEPIDSQTF